MTIEEARKRKDYKFSINELEDLISDIKSCCMKDMEENGDPYRGAAVLEIGYVDIEVNIFTREQCYFGVHSDKRPVIDYFCCLKYGNSNNDWRSDDYLDYSINVDWNADNWKEQLEKDMFEALNIYVEANGYSYDNPN